MLRSLRIMESGQHLRTAAQSQPARPVRGRKEGEEKEPAVPARRSTRESAVNAGQQVLGAKIWGLGFRVWADPLRRICPPLTQP